MTANSYQKHFVPLESNPDVFTQLIHDLGVSPDLSFQDVLTLDDSALFPRPALALILIFPTSDAYETQKAKEEAEYEEYTGGTDKEGVVWFKQTINNACGLYAILHAVCNGSARDFIQPESILGTLLKSCLPLNPYRRALILENSKELESVYVAAAMKGDTPAPTNAEDEVDFHYVCFVKSNRDSHIYELDGDRICPIDKGITIGSNDDMLSEGGLSIVREFIQRKSGDGSGFSLMALVPSP